MSIAKPARVGMAPSTAGSPDGDKLISDIKSSLDSIYENKVTVAGHKVHAVSPSKLEQLERRIDRALAHQGTSGASPNELIALHEQVAELRSENDRMKQRMSDAMKAESEALALRNESAAKLEAAMKDNEHAKAELGQAKKSLQSSMSKASADLKSAQEALKKSEARFDPDAALALTSAKTEAAAQVKFLNSELAKVNRQLAAKQEDFNKAVASMKAQTESFEAAKAATAQFKNALHDASTGVAKLEFSPAIEALLGKQACETLQGWHSIAFDNVKDRAFVGMKALSRHKNGLLSAIGKLFHAVYEWCKTQTVSARKALVPWMDMVMRDLLAAKLRAVSFYRDELKKLQVIADEQRAKRDKALKDSGKEPKQDKGEWFSNMWFYGYAIVLRVRRRVAPPTKKIAYSSVGALRAAKTWFIEMSKFQWAVYSELYVTGQLIPDGGKARVQFDTVWPSVVRSFWSAWPLEYQPLPEDEVVFEVPEDEAPEAKPL